MADTPVTVIQGARQVGKSTLVRQVLSGTSMFTLNNAPTLAAARADPVGFVRQNPGGLLAIDEVQRAPELILAIQDAVEEDRRPGRFLITGSANLLTLRGAHESLAGRAETVELYGFSQAELNGRTSTLIDRLLSGDDRSVRSGEFWLTRAQYAEIICAGSYPEPRLRAATRRRTWFTNYLDRVLTRDAVDVSRLPHLDRLRRLVRLLAAQSTMSTSTPSRVDASDFRGLRFLQAKLGNRFTQGIVLYAGDRALPFGERMTALPMQALWA